MGLLDNLPGLGQIGAAAPVALGGAKGQGLLAQLAQNPQLLNFGLAMLANSGYSDRKRSFGEIFGASALQARAMSEERAQRELQKKYLEARNQEATLGVENAQRQAADRSAQEVALRGAARPRLQESDPTSALSELQPMTPDPTSQLSTAARTLLSQGRIGPANELIGTLKGLQPERQNLPSSIQEYQYAVNQGFKGSYTDFQTQLRRSGATNVNVGGSDLPSPPPGTYRPTKGQPGLAPEPGAPKKELPVDERRAAVLFADMADSEKELAKLTGPGTTSVTQSVLASNPLTGLARSEDYRNTVAAQERWAANYIYLKSGATAPPEEVKSTARQYFPQTNDPPGTVKFKKRAREQALANIRKVYNAGTTPNKPTIYPPGSSEDVSARERELTDANDPLGLLKR